MYGSQATTQGVPALYHTGSTCPGPHRVHLPWSTQGVPALDQKEYTCPGALHEPPEKEFTAREQSRCDRKRNTINPTLPYSTSHSMSDPSPLLECWSTTFLLHIPTSSTLDKPYKVYQPPSLFIRFQIQQLHGNDTIQGVAMRQINHHKPC